MTQQFVAALDDLHRHRDVGGLVALFGDDATLNKVGMPRGEHGKGGARTFWEQYRDAFDIIDASFLHRIHDDEIAFLEWTSEGTLRDGTAFSYDGVSVLQLASTLFVDPLHLNQCRNAANVGSGPALTLGALLIWRQRLTRGSKGRSLESAENTAGLGADAAA